MPSLDTILTDLKNDLVQALQPYQPNLPPLYPNADPRAGAIPPTLITIGEVNQYPTLERLENHYAQVTMYFQHGRSSPMPYINNTATFQTPLLGSPSSGIRYMPFARMTKQVYIEVWSYDSPTRDAIALLIHQHLGDYYRIINSVDKTVELFVFEARDDEDMEQLDSVYVAEFTYRCDFMQTVEDDITVVEQVEERLTTPAEEIISTLPKDTLNIIAGETAVAGGDEVVTPVTRPIEETDTASNWQEASALLRGIADSSINITETATTPGDTPTL